jgi:hypothetical protein
LGDSGVWAELVAGKQLKVEYQEKGGLVEGISCLFAINVTRLWVAI